MFLQLKVKELISHLLLLLLLLLLYLVRIVKDCDLGLENAALVLGPSTAFSRPGSQFLL